MKQYIYCFEFYRFRFELIKSVLEGALNLSHLLKRIVFLFVGLTLFISCHTEHELLTPLEIIKANKIESGYQVDFKAKVDMMFLVDDSGSMSGYQKSLQTELSKTFDILLANEFLDINLAIMANSAGQGSENHARLQGRPAVVNSSQKGFQNTFNRRFTQITGHGSTEIFLDGLWDFLDPAKDNKQRDSFLRDDAFLVLVFLTDTDDQTERFGLDAVEQLYREILAIKGSPNMLLAYGIMHNEAFFGKNVGKNLSGCNFDSVRNAPDWPLVLPAFLSLFSNHSEIDADIVETDQVNNFYNVCDKFGPHLTVMAQDILSRIEHRVFLERRPALNTRMRVTIGVRELPQDCTISERGWCYENSTNSIIMGKNADLTKAHPDDTVQVFFDEARIDRR